MSTIMMDDFTVQVEGMPNNSEFEHKEELLRAKLWNHFKQVARREEFYEMIDEAKQNKDFE